MIQPGIYKVFVEIKENGRSYTARKMDNPSIRFRHVRFAYIDDSILLPPKEKKPALLARTPEGENFIIAYFSQHKDMERTEVNLVRGEKVFKAGDTRAFILSPSGVLGVYDIQRQDSGDLKLVTRLKYGNIRDDILRDDLMVNLEKLTLNLSGAAEDANIIMEQDDATGNIFYKFSGKSNFKDMSCRTEWKLENTEYGPLITYRMDLTPAPVTTLPPDGQFTPISSIALKLGSQSPTGPVMDLVINDNTKFSINMLGEVGFETLKGMVKFMIDKAGKVEVSNAKGNGKITMETDGSIKAESKMNIDLMTANGNGKINLAPDGSIGVNSKTGIGIVGNGGELLKIIMDYLRQEAKHIHPSPAGPTSGPANPVPYTVAEKKIKSIKGNK